MGRGNHPSVDVMTNGKNTYSYSTMKLCEACEGKGWIMVQEVRKDDIPWIT